jgi:hypothetical protein
LKIYSLIFIFIPHSLTNTLPLPYHHHRRQKKKKFSPKKNHFLSNLVGVSQLKMSVIAKLIQSSRAPVLAAHYRLYSAAG